jgi:acetate kinase
MMQRILTVNAGSSSLKLGWFDAESLECITRETVRPDADITAWITKQTGDVIAAGHRMVHGGRIFTQPVVVNSSTLATLKSLMPLAPLHLPHNIAWLEKLMQAYPQCKQIACFDTAFHHTIGPLERRFAIPESLHHEGIERYGFHGLSYEYIASVLPEHLKDQSDGKVIVAHLGNGSSMCAMNNRESIATTMGFSTLDGLMMGTRCGALDAGVVLHLHDQLKIPIHEIHSLLYDQSGLLGVSGISKDMHELETSTDPRAQFAIELYCHMAAKQLGSLMVSLGGLDALVFTGGIGEHSAKTRAGIARYFEWMDMKINTDKNHHNLSGISMDGSTIPVYVIPTNEEIVLATACRKNL